MRFLDYNGNGGLDPQDIATSVAVGEARCGEAKREETRHEEARCEEARREETDENASSARPPSENAGCATMAAFMVLPIIAVLLLL